MLATTAADDMKLVSEDEVARVMDKMVYTKAERKHLPMFTLFVILIVFYAYFIYYLLMFSG